MVTPIAIISGMGSESGTISAKEGIKANGGGKGNERK